MGRMGFLWMEAKASGSYPDGLCLRISAEEDS